MVSEYGNKKTGMVSSQGIEFISVIDFNTRDLSE